MHQDSEDAHGDSEKSGESVRAVERALDVLAAFGPGGGDLLAADIAKLVGLSRPTLYRLLNTLEKKGFVTSRASRSGFDWAQRWPSWRTCGAAHSTSPKSRAR